MSSRYMAGYSLIRLSALLMRPLRFLWRMASIPKKMAVIVWTPEEMDQYSKANWNSWQEVEEYAELDEWASETEEDLVERYFATQGELLNLACGAGREAHLLAQRGLRVTACDWSPRMIAAARSRAQASNLPVSFEVADLYNLQYPENSFDYAVLTNLTYSYFLPRGRRIRLLKQVHSFLKPGGLFLVSFMRGRPRRNGRRSLSEALFLRLARYAVFNQEYQPGICITANTCEHLFQKEELREEFEEVHFSIKEWLWSDEYVLLARE